MNRRFCVVAATAVGIVAALAFAARAEAQPAPRTAASAADAPDDVRALREELDRLREEFAAIRRQYDDRLFALEERLAAISGGPRVIAPDAASVARGASAEEAAAPRSPAPERPVPQDAALQSATPPSSAQVFNPATSVIGNFVAAAGRNAASAQPSFELGEAEVAFQAVVDPYSRADFYLAASPEGLEIEEGYLTFTALPADLLLKVGKLRAQFGKANTLHTHARPTADVPLVVENLIGGDEGLSDAGVSLSRLIHNPYVFLEATGEVYAGTSDVFATSRRSRLTYVGRLRAYRDLTEDKNLDLGASFAYGPTEGLLPDTLFGPDGVVPELGKRLIGVDATFRYRPLRRAIYSRLNLRTELVWSRQSLPAASHTTAFGFYGLGEYQFARRWYLGARVDRAGRVFDGTSKDYGGSFFVTFWPTEFSQIRSQYRRTRYAEGLTANELLMQVNFAIGAHGAHVF
ncbi:MAG: hypothetical protein IT184_14900 [Acidobacteria bacterium]|nr:hypothetical protein [Acidobacteriota bacterium]